MPEGVVWLRDTERGAAWIDALPRLLGEVADHWGLTVGDPYPGSNVSYTAPADRGLERLVVKLQWPHRESEWEAAALALWDGDGAVRLLDHDPQRHALLLERCEPGGYLADAGPDEALAALVRLLPRLWKPSTEPLPRLADEARGWAVHLTDRRGIVTGSERRLVDAAIGLLGELTAAVNEDVIVHQDLHGHNVLSSRREPWLVIDPKPLVGERELSVAPIVRSFELGHSRHEVLGRLDRLSADLGLDRERARAWAIVQTMAWSSDDGHHSLRHLQTASWLLDAESPPGPPAITCR
jgi:streptomycin 6-kinase